MLKEQSIKDLLLLLVFNFGDTWHRIPLAFGIADFLNCMKDMGCISLDWDEKTEQEEMCDQQELEILLRSGQEIQEIMESSGSGRHFGTALNLPKFGKTWVPQSHKTDPGDSYKRVPRED